MTRAILELNKVKVIVDDQINPILSETSLDIFPQEFVIILGHNGSGKSTLLKTITGETKPTSGEVVLDGQLLQQIPLEHRAQSLISLTQNSGDRLFLELTVEENIQLWESRFPIDDRMCYKKMTNSSGLGEGFIEKLNSPVSTLSGGEKQLLLMMLVFSHSPCILCLDEHTSALDYKIAHKVMLKTKELAIKNKVTTIMVTHSLEDALTYGKRIIVMKQGKIIVDKKNDNLSVTKIKECRSNIQTRSRQTS